MATNYKDGSSSLDEMTENDTKIGIKLVEQGGNRHGEYFLLDDQKNLRAGGKNGIFAEYTKIM